MTFKTLVFNKIFYSLKSKRMYWKGVTFSSFGLLTRLPGPKVHLDLKNPGYDHLGRLQRKSPAIPFHTLGPADFKNIPNLIHKMRIKNRIKNEKTVWYSRENFRYFVAKFFSSNFLESNQDLEHFITFPRVVRVKSVVNVRSYVTLQLDEGIYLLTRLYKWLSNKCATALRPLVSFAFYKAFTDYRKML